MQGMQDGGLGKPFFGYMTATGPVVISHPDLSSMDAFRAVKGVYTPLNSATNDGGDNMERRIAVLEADVDNIKNSVSDLKIDQRKAASDISDIKKDVAVMLQKLVDIDDKISKKPSTSEMTTAITSAVNKQIIWTVVTAIGVLGLARWIF